MFLYADGQDYDNVNTVVTFAVGSDTIQSITIVITNDLFVEADESFTVAVQSGNPRVTINGSPALIEIIDDDGKLHYILHI